MPEPKSIIDRIEGDWRGTSFKDFIIKPGHTKREYIPEKIDISTDLAGVKLYMPFIAAAMRSVVDKEFALEASKKMMAVAPRGLPIEEQVDIIRHVRENEVEPDQIESRFRPERADCQQTLGDAIAKVMEYGHSHIPVVDDFQHYKGMFIYKAIEHERADQRTPITKMIRRFRKDKEPYCKTTMSEEEVKKYMKRKNLRMVPILDSRNCLKKLMFLQKRKAYWVGAAIDTQRGWMTRAKELVDAGADMIFTDTSDGHSDFELDVVRKYKDRFPDGPPLCAGNIVTAEAFRELADAEADIIKIGMGPGSICTTNSVLAVGAPTMDSLIEVALEREKYFQETGKYIPIIPDGGMEDTYDMAIALTMGDAVMCGRLFACFEESAGELEERDGKIFKRYYGEASPEAVMKSGHTKRYFGKGGSFVYQGVSSRVPLKGRLKPGAEGYANALKQSLSHAGCPNLDEYRKSARMVRLTEASKYTSRPHGVDVID